MQRTVASLYRSVVPARFPSIRSLSSDSSKKDSSLIKPHFDKPIAEYRYGKAALQPVPKAANEIVGAATFNDDVIAASGVPDEHVYNRRARIFVPARTATQSGNNNTKTWKIELDNRERWENQLMGWCSTGDPLSNISMNMDFASKDDAIRFCERQGWEYEVEEPQLAKMRPKSYGVNYAWNSRTRNFTK